jgi:hypothetical protein
MLSVPPDETVPQIFSLVDHGIEFRVNIARRAGSIQFIVMVQNIVAKERQAVSRVFLLSGD